MAYFANIWGFLSIKSNFTFYPQFRSKEITKPDLEIKYAPTINFRDSDMEVRYTNLGMRFGRIGDIFQGEFFIGRRALLRFQIIDLFSENTVVVFSTHPLINFFKPFVNFECVINLIIELKLLQKNLTLVHAGAVGKKRECVLIGGWSESGKSTTVYRLAKLGFFVLGDDMILLDKYGNAYAISTCCDLRPDIFSEKVRKSETLRLLYQFSNFLPIKRKKRFSFGDELRCAKITKIFILLRGNENIRKISRKTGINLLLLSTLPEFELWFQKHVWQAYCYLFDFDVNWMRKKMRDILLFSLPNSDFYVVKKRDLSHFNDILNIINT